MIPNFQPKISSNASATSPNLKLISLAKLATAIAMTAISASSYSMDIQDSPKTPSSLSAGISVLKNGGPVARPDFVDLRKSSTAFNALANDVDPDGDPLIMVEATANFGAVAFTPEGLLAYAQEAGRFRADEITYTVSDGRGGIAKGVVEISVR